MVDVSVSRCRSWRGRGFAKRQEEVKAESENPIGGVFVFATDDGIDLVDIFCFRVFLLKNKNGGGEKIEFSGSHACTAPLLPTTVWGHKEGSQNHSLC